jgi:hypothetical protein
VLGVPPVPPLPASIPALELPPLPDMLGVPPVPLLCGVPPDPLDIALPVGIAAPPEPLFDVSSEPSAAQPAAAVQHNQTAKNRCFPCNIPTTTHAARP